MAPDECAVYYPEDLSLLGNVLDKIVASLPTHMRTDLAPKFYPILSSLQPLDLPGWAVVATGAGAEPSA
jgi:hypothetical protein